MYKIYLLILLLAQNVLAQDFVFFNESELNDYYDYSWGTYASPSLLTLVGPGNSKIPVDTTLSYSGSNSLKLNWTSHTNGNWAVAIAEKGWIEHDITIMDSIIFYIYSNVYLPSNELPQIYLEDINNRKTEKFSLNNFHGNINKNIWERISVPLQPIKEKHSSADITKIKTIFLGQSISDGKEHTIYIGDVRMTSNQTSDTSKPSVPKNVSAIGYERHVELKWLPNSESNISGYNIYKKFGNDYRLLAFVDSKQNNYIDFIGKSNTLVSYKISAIKKNLIESDKSNEITTTTFDMTDEQFLDMVQEYTFRYFWDYGHPISGLIRERLGSDDICTSGGTGFGVMALLVGIERQFITREQGAKRLKKITDFLLNTADKFHGAFPHWINGETGKVIPFSKYDNGGDLVETSFLIQGLLCAKQYFNKNESIENSLRTNITTIWQNVEWDWYRKSENSNFLYWHWSPNYNWKMNFKLQGPNETMIAYLLAIASPTHAIPASLYYKGWASSSNYKNGKTFYGYRLDVGWDYGGPLFFAHYSFLGFDPRNKRDNYTDYFTNNRNHTLINRAYCIDNPKGFTGYNKDTWGLTASDDPWGYLAHEPAAGRDNGTITPTAALSSFPYTPNESMSALKNFYRNYGEKIWKYYGFTDAFNVQENWYAKSFLAIDQGPIIIMIENYRTNLLWNLFMRNPEISPMLDSIGFKNQTTDVKNNKSELSDKLILKQNYPNPFNPTTIIEYSLPQVQNAESLLVQLKLYDILGRKIKTLVNKVQSPGNYKIIMDSSSLANGIYYYRISFNKKSIVKKMLILK